MNRTKLYTICLCLILGSITALSQSSWEWQNPLPQGHDLTDIVAVSPTTVFAAGKYGTFLRSTSSGADWELLPLPRQIDVRKIQFFSETEGYASGRLGLSVYLYFTQDAGNSWAERFSSAATSSAFHFLTPLSGWISSDSVVHRTLDGGLSWSSIGFSPPLKQITFVDSLVGWGVPSGPPLRTVIRTTDGGGSWAQLSINQGIPIVFVTKLVPRNQQVAWIVGNDYSLNSGSILRTTDAGASWEWQAQSTEVFVDIATWDSVTGWAQTWRGLVYRTTNGGTVWEPVSTQANLTSIYTRTNTELWGSGLNGALYKSINAGDNWTKSHEGDVTGPSDFYANLHIVSASVIAGFQSNWLLKTTNAGATWNVTDLRLDCTAMKFTDELHGWAGIDRAGGNGWLVKTTDGGTNWYLQVDSISLVSDIFFRTQNDGWFVAGHRIYHTTNAGQSWSPRATIANGPGKILFTSAQEGWIGASGAVLHSTDGGDTWKGVSPEGTNPLVHSMSFTDPLHGWILGTVGLKLRVFKTSDSGKNWSSIELADSGRGFGFDGDIQMLNALHGWLVWLRGGTPGSQGGAYHTTDGGTSWTRIELPTDKRLQSIAFADDFSGWILATGGSILHTSTGGTFVDDSNGQGFVSMGPKLLQNYPNPFNPVTNFQFSIVNRQLTILKVYDLLGREVATIVNENLEPGTYQRTFSGEGLPSGVYFYRLTSGEFTETRKLLLMK